MVLAVTLTAFVLGLAAPSGAVAHASDSAALAAVASSCAGATTAGGDQHSRLEAMYCGINVVRRAYRLGFVRGSVSLNRSSLMKADAVRRCGLLHTPCRKAVSRPFKQAGYPPAPAVGWELA